MSPFELRLALKAKGYSSIPLMGKRPTLAEWQTKADATEEEMRRWSGPNTGLLTEFTPAFDIDITHPEAADAVEGAVRDWFDGRGIVPVRFGNAPKRAMLLRTAKPFPKIVAPFTDPAGNKHKIEVLGAGQQLAVHGIHPDAKVPWTWHSGTPWSEVPHSDLPEVDENEMRELLRFVSDLLVQEFGFEVLERGDGERAVGADDQPDRPVDVDAELADMTFLGGEVNGIHYTQLRCTAALLRSGVAIDDVVEQVFAATERAGSGQPWNWELERRGIRQMCGDFIVKNPELEDVLPPHAREQLRAVAAAGKRPKIVFSTQYNQWQVRGYGPSSDYDSSERRSYGKTEGDAPKGGGSFKLRPFVPFDPAALPPREWLYGRHYQRRTVSATVAPGGFGKTTLCMVEAVAMATTMNLLGEQPTERLRVWYHNGEDNIQELNRRLGAICLHYNIPMEELAGWFFMTSGNEVPLRVAKGYGDLKIDNSLIRCINNEIVTHDIDVAILDPLVTLHGVEERDNGRMDTVIRIFAATADSQNCAIELAHHTRKQLAGSSADYGVDDMRGASSVKDAVRAARMLNQMPDKDADDLGIAEHERGLYFRVDRVKGNNAPPEKAVWRKFINVELPNSDDVGVVIPYDYPGQGNSPDKLALEREADKVFLEILTRFLAEGRTVSEKSGTNYAPHVFSLETEARDAKPKINKRRLVDAMRRLFVAKRIRVEQSDRRGGRKSHVLTLV